VEDVKVAKSKAVVRDDLYLEAGSRTHFKERVLMTSNRPAKRPGAGPSNLLLAAALCLLGTGATRAAPVSTAHVEAELVTETTTIQPGKPFDVGVRMKMIPKWHTYWINAGDSGYATKIDWKLPDGFQAGPIIWPHPLRLPLTGAVNFGYENEILLLTQLTAPASLNVGKSVPLKAHVTWLVCEVVCVPEEVDVSAIAEVADVSPLVDPRWKQLFARTRHDMPTQITDWHFSAEATTDGYRLIATPNRPGISKPTGNLFFFSSLESIVENMADQPVTVEGDKVVATLTRETFATDSASHLRGVWVAPGGWQDGRPAALIDVDVAPGVEGAPLVGTAVAAAANAATKVNQVSTNLFASVLLALLGGLILNLMPCVFPVLGLKIMGFVEQAGASRRKVAMHGLAFTGGVLISFWTLATFLAILRAGGQELGWGFQLQSPVFVFTLAIVLLVFALNLSGVFEFGISATAVGGDLHGRHGLVGTFFTGLLATVVATPCSAPFLAPALGAAVTLPMLESFVVFTAIGIGLSLPYLLLSIFPQAVRVLPRPGRWMETFKQLMAFPLYATAIYLMWVLAGQVSDDMLLNVGFGFVFVAMGVWAYGRWSAPGNRPGAAWIAVSALLLLGGSGLWLGWPQRAAQQQGAPPAVVWDKWSPETVARLQAEGRYIYVDFTARWCATCQTNKKVVFHSDKVLQQFAARKVATLRADWTNNDPQITAELAKYQRSAIPFDLLYKPGGGQPVELPALLTPDIVLKEFD
jgi:thiol:disulfide interchange protein/DsbC/DsbD-like thiol-disulfide interchange protein